MRLRRRLHVDPVYGECWSHRPKSMPRYFDPLARYNAEVARGVVHTTEHKARMEPMQEQFVEWGERVLGIARKGINIDPFEFAHKLDALLHDHDGPEPRKSRVTYKDGWTFAVEYLMTRNAALVICVHTSDSETGEESLITHRVPIPTYREPCPPDVWLMERIFDVEKHEAMEFFKVDGKAPFYPDHSRPYEFRRAA